MDNFYPESYKTGIFSVESRDLYYIFSIYRGYIWYDSAHSTTEMIKLRPNLHSRTPPHNSPLRSSFGMSFMSYTKKNGRDLSTAHCIPVKNVVNENINDEAVLLYCSCYMPGTVLFMGLLPDTWTCGEIAGNAGNGFPATDFKGNRYLAIPTCITPCALRTCRDACRDR